MKRSLKSRRYGAVTRPMDLHKHFNWPREGKGKPWWKGLRKEAERVYRGKYESWGIPFQFGDGEFRRMFLLASDEAEAVVPVGGRADYVCFLHIWKWGFPAPVDREKFPLGAPVAQYELEFADGTRHIVPIRNRFEINSHFDLKANMFFPAHLAVPLDKGEWLDPAGPVVPSRRNIPNTWGSQQAAYRVHAHLFWDRPMLYAMPNPHPAKRIRSITLRGLVESPVLVAAITLYQGSAHPLRHLPTRTYRVRVEEPAGKPHSRGRLCHTVHVAKAGVDMGHVVRIAPCDEEKGPAWLRGLDAGLNYHRPTDPNAPNLLELTGAPDAEVSVDVRQKGGPKNFRFSLGEAFHQGVSRSGGAALEVLGAKRQWVQVRVLDSSTGKPTPVRIHFAGPRGDYLPPWGHHGQINTNWFEDYGADVRTGGRNHAYVNGEFAIDLPVGEVYVEASKGFEYQPVRRRVTIRPGQKTLEMGIDRWADWRREGWVTADTHVHFISPHTAWLEGQAEGVNVVNVLSAKWERMFSNTGDLMGRPNVEQDDTIVYVGYENTDHMMAHMSLLGGPRQSGCPVHGDLGDTRLYGMAAWAASHRKQGGFVIRPHFPYFGATEDPVAILHGLVDALEIVAYTPDIPYSTQEWYRYLNCGYRVGVAGGTDKMSAAQVLGGLRTYARIDGRGPLTYNRWGQAVRAGRTFATNGPLIDIEVEGQGVGQAIRMPAGGGTLNVRATAQSAWPLGTLEVVFNGKVVASTKSAGTGVRNLRGNDNPPRRTAKNPHTLQLALTEQLSIPTTGWLAARCRGADGHLASFQVAHTSPVYVQCGRTRAFDGPAAQHMLTLVEGGIEHLSTLSTPHDDDSHRENLRLFKETRRELLKRLAASR